MRLRVKRPDDLELNLISLVDVVLLLVIFFMLSTTFIQDARLRVELPEAGSGDGRPLAAPDHHHDLGPGQLPRQRPRARQQRAGDLAALRCGRSRAMRRKSR